MLKKSLNEQIYEELKMDIIQKRIKLGDKLINKNLQERFQVSSTPIRDAINRLYSDGLLREVTRAGAQVIVLDANTYRETNEILSILNCAMVKKSNNKNLKLLIKKLNKYVMLQEKKIDSEEYFNNDYKFHKSFFDYGNNTKCKELFKKYNALHELIVRYYHLDLESKKKAINSHKTIINFLEKGDFLKAELEMENHYTLLESSKLNHSAKA